MSVNYPRGSGRIAPARPAATTHEEAQSPLELTLTPPPDTKAVRRNQQIEFAEQRAFFDQVNAKLNRSTGRALPEWPGADMIYAVPNSNAAGVVVGVKLVQSGLRKGYPDINVDAPRVVHGHSYHGLRIEMKQPQGVMSDVEVHQREWHERLRDQGYKVCVCFGWREALSVTTEYLGWPAS